MYDFPNKIFSLILVFIMLVVTPTVWVYINNDGNQKREAFNETTKFLDKVTDRGKITKQDLDELYLGLNATGGTYDATVERHMQTPTPDPNNPKENRMVYINMDYMDKDTGKPIEMVQGDLVTVKVKEVGTSPAKRLLWLVLKLDSSKDVITLTSMVK